MYMFTLTLASLISGTAIRRFGSTKSWMGIGIAIFAISSLLLTGLKRSSTVLRWLPFTLGSALGAGICLQLPFVIVASELGDKDKITGSK